MTSSPLLRRERRIRLAAVLLILAAALGLVIFVDGVLVSLVIAFVLKYMLNPFVARLERRGLSRQWSVVIPFTVLVVALGVLVASLVPSGRAQIGELQLEWPRIKQGMQQFVHNTQLQLIGDFAGSPSDGAEKVNVWLGTQFQRASIAAPRLLSQSLTVLFLAPLFAFFLLLDGKAMARSLLHLAPNHLFEMFLHLMHQINERMGGFVRARLLESIIVGGVVWVGLALMQFPYAFLLGVFAGATNLIPYLGPFIAAIPAVAMVALSPDVAVIVSPSVTLFLVVTVYVVGQLVDVFIVIPMVVAKIVDLHPLVVILAIIVGAEVMGVLGMIISIPLASASKLIFSSVYDHLVHFKSS